MNKRSFNFFPPGSLVSYFDQQHRSFVYKLVTERRFFHKRTFESLELSLQALKQHLTSHKFQEVAIPKLGCGYDQLHWQTVFSIFSQSYFFRFEPHNNNTAVYTLTAHAILTADTLSVRPLDFCNVKITKNYRILIVFEFDLESSIFQPMLTKSKIQKTSDGSDITCSPPFKGFICPSPVTLVRPYFLSCLVI